jgi:AraC-like DNA-binding protein
MMAEAEYNPWQSMRHLESRAQPLAPLLAPVNAPRFDTSNFHVREQFERFAMEVSAIGEMLATPSHAVGFRAHVQGLDFGSSRLILGGCEEVTFVRTKQDVVGLGIDHWVLWLTTNGSVDLDVGGATHSLNPNRLALLSMEQPFQARYRENRHGYFFIPRNLFPGLEGALVGLANTHETADPFHDLVREYLLILTRMLPKMTACEAKAAEDAAVAMIRASICGTRDSLVEAQLPILAAQFERAKRVIESNLASPSLGVEHLQAELGISRRQVCKIFERSGGVGRFIRSRRLEACFRLLQEEAETRPIREIAESFGFTNVAHFGRLFRAEFDRSAEEVRLLAHQRRQCAEYRAWLQNSGVAHKLSA